MASNFLWGSMLEKCPRNTITSIRIAVTSGDVGVSRSNLALSADTLDVHQAFYTGEHYGGN